MNRLRVLVLLAWRDALRHKGRSLLILGLVALPVLVIGAADVMFRSTQATPQQQADAELAGSSAYLWAPTGAVSVEQDPTASWPSIFTTAQVIKYPDPGSNSDVSQEAVTVQPSERPLRPVADVLPLLPPGTTVTRWEQGTIPISADTAHYRTTTADLLDVTSPAAGNRYRLLDGVLPTRSGDIALTGPLASDLGVGIGATVSAGSPARPLTVVGTVRAGTDPTNRAVVGLPGSITGAAGYSGPRYLALSPAPISWNMVQELNSHGIQVYSRAVVLNPPYVLTEQFDSTAALSIASAVILVVLGLTQVIFLSGPAFAIAARRMRRQLGLATAVGAGPGQVAGVVLSTGLLLGVVGSVAGTAIGAVVGWLVQPLLSSLTGMQFAAINIRVGELALIAALGAVTGLLAAGWPAVTALRTDPIAALARRAKPPKRPGVLSLIGLLVAAAGGLVIVWAATRSVPTGPDVRQSDVTEGRSIWIAAGVLATQLGLIVGAPQIIVLIARLGRLLPTAPRMALRTAARHRGRSTGAIATILVATTGAVLGAVLISSTDSAYAAEYHPDTRPGLVTGQLHQPFWSSPDSVDRAVELPPGEPTGLVSKQWPGIAVGTYITFEPRRTTDSAIEMSPTIPPANRCPWFSPGSGVSYDAETPHSEPSPAELPAARLDPRCPGMSFSSITPEQAHFVGYGWGRSGLQQVVVADANFRRILTGVEDPAGDAALAAGRVLVLDRRYLDAAGRFSITEFTWDPQTGQRKAGITRTALGTFGAWSVGGVAAIVPPSAAAALGGRAGDPGFVVHPDSVTDSDLDALQAGGAALGFELSAYAERGPWRGTGLPSVWLILLIAAVLIVGTVLVVTALGVVDGDDDSATFAAVGASARLRRTLSGWSAFTTTGIGCLLGAGAGLLVGWGMFRLLQNVDHRPGTMTVPWPQLAILVFGLPIAAFALAALFTRAKIQLIRRVE